MRLKFVATAIVAATALSLLAAPANAETKKKQRVVAGNGHTVFVSRDEDGRTRTRIIIQKRSYLDPGTEQFPGETSIHNYAWAPNHHADSVLDNVRVGTHCRTSSDIVSDSLRLPWVRRSEAELNARVNRLDLDHLDFAAIKRRRRTGCPRSLRLPDPTVLLFHHFRRTA